MTSWDKRGSSDAGQSFLPWCEHINEISNNLEKKRAFNTRSLFLPLLDYLQADFSDKTRLL
jgi:hypothetical protein